MSANHERFFQVMLIALTILIVLAVSQAKAFGPSTPTPANAADLNR